MIKLLQGLPLSRFANSFTNLALPLFTSAEPDPPRTVTTTVKGVPWKWTPWDRIDLPGRPDITLNELITHCNQEYGADVAMLSAGVSILYSSFSNPKKAAERRVMPLRHVYEQVTKRCLPSQQKYLILELILNDADSGDEMEVPYVRLHLR